MPVGWVLPFSLKFFIKIMTIAIKIKNVVQTLQNKIVTPTYIDNRQWQLIMNYHVTISKYKNL